jgi:hypothetical protein
MQRMGYDVRYWFMSAWKYGAALQQEHLAVAYFLPKRGHIPMASPASSLLPPRPMSNLLMPMGIPHKAWSKQAPKSWPQKEQRCFPGHVTSHIGGSPVYRETGVMPDEVSSWIHIAKGTRRLQYSELAKAKGITKATKDYTSSGARAAIRDGTCIHVWTAALDTIADWLRTDP